MPMRLSRARATPRQRYRPQQARFALQNHSSPLKPFTPHTASHDLLPVAYSSRAGLRRELRHRRRMLSQRQQSDAARGMVNQLLRYGILRRSQRIALYLPADGELDPIPLLRWLRRFHITAYVPVLRPSIEPGLWFIKLTPETRLTRNEFNLLEPILPRYAHRADSCPAWALDIVLMPLVGFDASGARLGMGGGFYDRTFGSTYYPRQPRLIGLAHDIQEVVRLPTEQWDVPLDMIITGTRCICPDK